MSRNLCTDRCERCGALEVKLDEEPRLITPDEAGVYYAEYKGMMVANATCPRCQAQYLAWVRDNRSQGRSPDYGMEYFDLSYRSTFNDEPGDEDLPTPTILAEFDWALGFAYGPMAREYPLALGRLVAARELLGEMLGERQ